MLCLLVGCVKWHAVLLLKSLMCGTTLNKPEPRFNCYWSSFGLIKTYYSMCFISLHVELVTTSTKEVPPVCWQQWWPHWTWSWWKNLYRLWILPKILVQFVSWCTSLPLEFLTQMACLSMVYNKSIWVDSCFVPCL